MINVSASRHPASFRDPSGFIFMRDGIHLRLVAPSYKQEYDLLMASGLYQELQKRQLLIHHTEVTENIPEIREEYYKIVQPEQIPFISYPYEWSFAQLQDAALTMLKIQRIAMEYGMSLKDAYARNMQFLKGKTVLIDTLSFEKYLEGDHWAAYSQFCENFYFPLVLMSSVDASSGRLLQVYLDGIPLERALPLLSLRARFNRGVFIHIILPYWFRKRLAHSAYAHKKTAITRAQLLRIIDSLESSIKCMRAKYPTRHSWVLYYEGDSYSESALQNKKDIVSRYLRDINPKIVWDLGANTGLFSQLAAQCGASVIAFDTDPQVVEQLYLAQKQLQWGNILPLMMDLANPSPAQGWHHREYASLVERGPADLTLALAVMHHLCLRHNVPVDRLAEFLSVVSRALIIEFIPKGDPKVQLLLSGRDDVFSDYHREGFEHAFTKYFSIENTSPIQDSLRILYYLRSRRYG